MATSFETVLMTGEFAPESFGGVLMSGNAFNFLGVPPVVGRTIQPTDIRPDGQAEPVVVLSHGCGCGCSRAVPPPSAGRCG